MKKKFDCIEMKRKAQEKIYEETKDLSQEQEIECFHNTANQFWKDIRSLQEKKKKESVKQGK